MALMPSALNQKKQIRLTLGKPNNLNNQFPISTFKTNSYNIVSTDTQQEKAQANTTQKPILSSHLQTSTLSSSSNKNTEIWEKLINIESQIGAVWGMRTLNSSNNSLPDHSPVLLSNIKRMQNNSLEATLEYPYINLSETIEIMLLGDKHIMFKCNAEDKYTKKLCSTHLNIESNNDFNNLSVFFSVDLVENKRRKEYFRVKDLPWEKKKAPTSLLQIGASLWDSDSGELLEREWIPNIVRPIENMPGMYWNAELSGYNTPYIPIREAYPIAPSGKESITLFPNKTEEIIHLSKDRQHYIQIKDGDIWLGEINWPSRSIKPIKNITQLGILQNIKIKAWYKDELYIWRSNAGDKPLLHINLATGKIKELKFLKAFNNDKGSPDGRFQFSSNAIDKTLYVYDLEKSEAFTMEATSFSRVQGSISKDHAHGVEVDSKFWLSNNVFFSGEAFYALESQERIVLTNLTEILKTLPFYIQVSGYRTILGGEFLDISFKGSQGYPSGNVIPNSDTIKRYRFNYKTNVLLELPSAVSKKRTSVPVWIDKNRYIFYRTSGDLNEIGTWLYDVTSQRYQRLSILFPDGRIYAKNPAFTNLNDIERVSPTFITHEILILPDSNKIGFATKKEGTNAYVLISLDNQHAQFLELPKTKGNNRYAHALVNSPITLP